MIPGVVEKHYHMIKKAYGVFVWAIIGFYARSLIKNLSFGKVEKVSSVHNGLYITYVKNIG